MGSRSKLDLISESDDYKQLLNLPSISSSQTLTYRSIFKSVSTEIETVQADVVKVNEHILNDIQEELRQTGKIERKLKSSFKSINQHYMKLLKHRKNFGNDNSSVLFQKFDERAKEIMSKTEEADHILDNVLKNLVDFDSSLPVDERLFSSSKVTKRHYPMLYDLIHDKFGDIYKRNQELENDSSKISVEERQSIEAQISEIDKSNILNDKKNEDVDDDTKAVPNETPRNLKESNGSNINALTQGSDPCISQEEDTMSNNQNHNCIESSESVDKKLDQNYLKSIGESISSVSSVKNRTRIFKGLVKPVQASTSLQALNVIATDTYKLDKDIFEQF